MSVGTIVFPGEAVNVTSDAENVIRLGAGLYSSEEGVIATKAGLVRCEKEQGKYHVDGSQKRYIPGVEDMVLGVITEKGSEWYKVDIGASNLAQLSAIAFDGATRRNKPNLNVGTLVYCRVIEANRDMDPEISCESTVGKKDWVTGESTFGEIKGGYMCKVPLVLAQRLLDGRAPVLEILGRSIPYELAIGANGRVWVNAERPSNTVAIANAIQNSTFLDEAECEQMVGLVLSKLSQAGE